MTPELHSELLAAFERPHRLGTIGGDLEEQLAHCASFSSVLAQLPVSGGPHRGVDLGTGGGLPGVALAALRPAMAWTLVDMRTARATEVERIVHRLGLSDRVDVLGLEAQFVGHDEKHRGQYDLVVARAFGPPSLTAECASPLLVAGGWFIVSEPPGEVSQDRWSNDGLTRLGLGLPQFFDVAGAQFAAFEKIDDAPDTTPRLPPRSTRGWLGT